MFHPLGGGENLQRVAAHGRIAMAQLNRFKEPALIF